ncbi:MAG: 3-carboxy-cis,cis-muconate cycloisomerase [Armatimonadota bacterium]|nr:3-carboxy-cis,cis-muconate cycloisomerase [Armatimonadota bacterium]
MFTTPEMASVFSSAALVRRMLAFEVALARAQAAARLIPPAAAEAIAAACDADEPDLPALFREAAEAGTPAVPLVRRLTARTAAAGRGFVHWGATSQDVVDTALVLQMRDGLGLLERGLRDVAAACAGLASRYRGSLMPGRTLLQHAVPITFGLKAARWLAAATRLRRRLRDVRAHVLAVQFGGAAGTLAALGPDGPRVTELLARELDLAAPEVPWHTERDRIGEVAGALGVVAATMGKIASDLVLLSQTEVAEVSTGAQAGAGRSSTMPQKRNPVEAVAASACARLALGVVPVLLAAGVQEHERGAGGWQAEWEALPALFRYTAGAVDWVRRAVETLAVDEGRMAANMTAAHGLMMAEALVMALAPRTGRDEAYRLVADVCAQAARAGADLREAAAADERVAAALSGAALERVLDPARYLGSADAFIDRALAAFAEEPA